MIFTPLKGITNNGDYVSVIGAMGTDSKFKFICVGDNGKASLYDSDKINFNLTGEVGMTMRLAQWYGHDAAKVGSDITVKTEIKDMPQDADK